MAAELEWRGSDVKEGTLGWQPALHSGSAEVKVCRRRVLAMGRSCEICGREISAEARLSDWRRVGPVRRVFVSWAMRRNRTALLEASCCGAKVTGSTEGLHFSRRDFVASPQLPPLLIAIMDRLTFAGCLHSSVCRRRREG